MLSGHHRRLYVVRQQCLHCYPKSQFFHQLFLFSILHLQLINFGYPLSPDLLPPQALPLFVDLNYRFPYQIYLSYPSYLPFPYQLNLIQQVYLSYQPNLPNGHRLGDQDYQYYRLRHVN